MHRFEALYFMHTFRAGNIFIFDQFATLDNVYKRKKVMGWLAQKNGLILQIFMDFEMYGFVAFTSFK